MKCSFCGYNDTQVTDSRMSEDGYTIRRRRRCLSCKKRFSTLEVAELRMPHVIKRDGHRSNFDLEKLKISFFRALHKRPVPIEAIDQAVNVIRNTLLQLGEREVSSRLLGEMVMKELAKLDKVAYVRFASVYKSFQGIDEFTETIEEIKQKD